MGRPSSIGAPEDPLLGALSAAGDSRKSMRGSSKNSSLQSSVALFKAIVGTGMFALPPAIRSCGVLLGSALAVLMAVVSVYTMGAIISTIQEMRRRGVASASDGRIEFNEMTGAAFPYFNWLVTLVCIFGQLGSIVGFMAFVCVAAMLQLLHLCLFFCAFNPLHAAARCC